MNLTIEDTLTLFKQFLQDAKTEQCNLIEELRIVELKQQDLLHEIEISPLNARTNDGYI